MFIDYNYAILDRNISDLIYFFDFNKGEFSFMNRAGRKFFGIKIGEIPIQGDKILNNIHSDDFSRIKKIHNTILSEGLENVTIEYRIKNSEDEYKWFSDKWNIIKNDKGIIVGYEGIMRDITDKKLLELELKKRFEYSELINKILILATKNNSYKIFTDLILKELGDFLNVSRTYIFEKIDNQFMTNTFEWCNKGIDPEYIKITSDSTGAGSSIEIITDEANLFGNEIVVPGYDELITLDAGWNLISTGYLINDSLSELVILRGNEYNEIIYKHDGEAYLEADIEDIKPVDALYIKTDAELKLGLIYSEEQGNPTLSDSKLLREGWNLLSVPENYDGDDIEDAFAQLIVGNQKLTDVYDWYNSVPVHSSAWDSTAIGSDEGFWVRLNSEHQFTLFVPDFN